MNKIKILLVSFVMLMVLPFAAVAGDYVIGEGDGLDIAVWGVKELSFPARVRPDGKITVPGLGDIHASGSTPAALQAQLTVRLKELVKNPIVTVTVREITNSKVYIFGGGINSGVYDLNRRTTLLQLLCSLGTPAAGSSPAAKSADYKRAYVLRSGKKIKENFYNLFVKGDTAEDIIIESGDSLFVPQLLDRNVYVLGAVNASKAIEYREGMTVMEAILEAGGFTKYADQNDIVIRRKNDGKDSTLTVKAKKLLNNGDLTQNVQLKAGDYILVMESFF
ncbi:MAG: polysaccharide biosynthesis/export family protein [Desulfuromonadaceae bacterium]|nr:polysaccharide biosynthesis/export family protein [Desulfuromonadaceae bacterium]MDD5104845.1 polysaccharide biosynthesis/export family protein [Desulfuromonadaceae bacterium]